MGNRLFKTFSIRAPLRPHFRAIFRSMDCLDTRALPSEPLSQTPPCLSLLLGPADAPTRPNPFCPLPMAGQGKDTQKGPFPGSCPGMCKAQRGARREEWAQHAPRRPRVRGLPHTPSR